MADAPAPISLARCFQYLIERSRGGFFGTIAITFKRGAIVSIHPEQVFVRDNEIPIDDEAAVELMQTGRYAPPVP